MLTNIYRQTIFPTIFGFTVIVAAVLLMLWVLCELGNTVFNLSTNFRSKLTRKYPNHILIKKFAKSLRPMKFRAGDYIICRRSAWLKILSDVIVSNVISLRVMYKHT